MKPIPFRAWLISSVFTSCTIMCVVPAQAQTSGTATVAAPTQGLSTITVTARKKKENLQHVPLSVTAIPAKTLKQAHVDNLHDVLALTPGVNISDAGAESVTSVSIRGDTDQTFGQNIPDVAFFLDDAFLRDPTAINVAAIPLSDVEVVKGPVSALYGRDAFAGVIAYTAARPTTTPHADISETAGDYGKSELQGDISGPIFGDKVLGEVFGDFDTFNGTYKDKVSGANAGGFQKKDFGGLLDFNWSDNFTTHIDFYYGDDYFDNPAIEHLTPNCGGGGPAAGEFHPQIGPNGVLEPNAPDLYCGQVKTNGSVQVPNDPGVLPGNVRRTFYTSMNNTATFDWGTLTAVTGASQVDESAIQPFGGFSLGQPYQLANSATPATPNGNSINENSFYGSASNTGNFSQEFRYNSPVDLPLRVGAGGFFYDEARTDVTAAGVSDGNVPAGEALVSNTPAYAPLTLFESPTGIPTKNVNSDKRETNEEAAFANAEYDILPNLTVSTQYRYTWYNQQFGQTYGETSGPGGPSYHSAEQFFATNEALRWFPIPNQMLYFAFANGLKPGGFNNGAPPAYSSYAPETDMNFEGGFKTQLFDNRLQLDAAAYHEDVSNLQLYVPVLFSEYFLNEGKTSNTGFEIDARALPVDGLTITGGFNYNNPTFDNGTNDAADAYNCSQVASCAATEKMAPNGFLIQPVGGHSVPSNSKYTLSLETEYDFLVANQFPAYVRGDLSYKSSQFTDPSNLTSIGAQTMLDLFAGITRGRYTLSAYIKNVTNDESANFFQYESTLDAFSNQDTVSLNPGRTFAFTVAAHF